MPSRYETTTINLALRVLAGVVPSSRVQGDPKPLRLALRVILPHIRDHPALAQFWLHATKDPHYVYETCIGPYLAIVSGLKKAGFEIDADIDYHSGR